MKSSYPIVVSERLPLQDHCGVVAAFASQDIPFFRTILSGLLILQTRGYDGAGFCALDSQGVLHQHKGIGMVREVFSPPIQKTFTSTPARIWVSQVRYGTNGGFIPENVQPIIDIHKKTGDTFIVAHNGQFSINPDEPKTTMSDTLLFTKLLSNSQENTWDERILNRIQHVRGGAWSLIIATRDALFVARDPYGFRPLTYGHVWDKMHNQFVWVAASETSALDAMGATEIYELLPGCIAKVTEKGLILLNRIENHKRAFCIFENIYIHHGAGRAHIPRTNQRTIRKSPTVDDVRRRSGKILAREAPLTYKQIDIVIGVPGTGIEGGMTYARSLDLPYFQAISDAATNLTEQRTFMTADIDSIYQKVLEHFRFDAQSLNNRRVVLVDDSMVRGNITKGLIYLLKTRYHVPSVHVRILSPPINKGCHLGVNTRTNKELIAARLDGDVEKIRIELDAASLVFLSSQGLREAITGNPKATGFCMGCMLGHMPPIDIHGNAVNQKTNRIKVQKILLPNQIYEIPQNFV
jgi:amidophosphoribosyltransferase